MPEDITSVKQGIQEVNPVVDKLRELNPIEKLRSTLMEEHHPYGLLLMSAPFISAAGPTAYHIDDLGLSSSSLLVYSSSDTNHGQPGKLLKDFSSAGALGLFSSGHSPEASLTSAGFALSSMGNEEDQLHMPIAALLSVLGASAGSDPNLANAFRNSFEFTAPQAEAMVVPLSASAKQKEVKSFSLNRMEIRDNKLRVGSVVANVCVYIGRKEFTITGGGLDKPYVIKPGDIFLTLHVNQSGEQYAQMEPIARVRAIKRDFQKLCRLLEKPDQFELSDEQRQQIERLREAPMIGVSHLVKLIAARGLPTWGIESLPKLVQQFHTFDSQVVSKLFGGQRKVNSMDIRVMFLPASMRSQIMA
ncbi:MAG: hypothetical protein KatS3mg088_586 [Patescibacteria group bacterium]|nr:MAG: hypothetical protein KatS3mg088_586 [Patescibacteria group bacterium]